MSSTSPAKFKSDVDQLDDLVKDLLTEVNRPISNSNTTHRYSYQRQSSNDLPSSKLSSSSTLNNNHKQHEFDTATNNTQRSKTTREERIRIKRGVGTEIPVTTSSSSMTTTTTTKPHPPPPPPASSAAIDEHLIDSLLESVQNTLKKRAQRNQSNWSTDVPVSNRRTHSSSAAYTDSVHHMDPSRGRFPIKLYRSDSPTSTLSSRRPHSRQDSRDGYMSSSTTTAPTRFRATSEPPPDGPIELHRMDLIRSPSRTYIDSHPPPEYYHYSRSTIPPNGIRGRSHDYGGYETDTGLMTSRSYAPRYYRAPPPPSVPMYPYYPPPETHRPMFRPDGYDTDSGLISSGRLHMTRTLPSRMAVIPETVIVNNRMVPSTNLNAIPPHLRTSSFLNQGRRSENISGYETDSGMNTRQYHYGHGQVPVHVQRADRGWTDYSQQQVLDNTQRFRQVPDQFRGTSVPVFSRQPEQHQQMRTTNILPPPLTPSSSTSTVQTAKKDISILPSLFPGSVGLSNPLSSNQSQEQRTSEAEIKRKLSNDQTTKRSARPHGAIIDSAVLPASIATNVSKVQTSSSTTTTTTAIVPNANNDNQSTKTSLATASIPVINQSYNANIQTRVGNSSLQSQDESSRRSSLSSATESDAPRNGAYQAHNVSQFWYKEKISRDDAINLLKNKPTGTFLIRDSQGFPGSYGLAVKVETLPPGIQSKPGADPNAELVRHYLIERTPTGHVRLKGCPNEPDFSNLSALVYQHTLISLALPVKLVLPSFDIAEDYRATTNYQQQETKKMSIKDLLEKGAACNVIYLNNVDVDSLSGQMAVANALRSTFDNPEQLQATIVNFKVSNTGITLTDTKKKLFSRRHFPKEYVTYCGMDYESDRFWTHQYADVEMLSRAKCFGFVSKKINGAKSSQPENECHIFAEIDSSQPSSAIVNFVSKVMIGSVPV